MTIRSILRAAVPAVALLAAAGCATNPQIEVKRFHLGAPVTRGTIAIVAANPAVGGTLEFASYATAVANELRNAGFTPIEMAAGPAYVGTLTITQNVSVGPEKPSPVSIGIGGGSFGRSGGVGGSVAFPVGKGGRDAVELDALALQIKRRSDSALIWEGTATAAIDTKSPAATLSNAVPRLAKALLDGFPGPSGVSQRYPIK